MAQDDIQGQVVDGSGNPVSGAIVELTKSYQSSPTGQEAVQRTTTDSNGNYIFTGHPDGDGTTQEWHVAAYSHDGTAYVNSFNNPGVTADLPSNAIPDSGDLHAHYDATQLGLSDGATVSTFTANVGPNLSAVGAPTYQTGVQNGNAVVRYGGINDGHFGQLSSSQGQPNHAFIAFRLQSLSSSSFDFVLGTQRDPNLQDFAARDGGLDWFADAEAGIRGGSPDTNWHIAAILYDGVSSNIRIDASQVASGDVGDNAHDDIALAYLADQDRLHAEVDIGEVLWYSADKSSNVSEIEAYLNNKWGVY